MTFSKEYIYHEVAMLKHCLCLRLKKPIEWDIGQMVEEVFVIGIACSEQEAITMMTNVVNRKNTEGQIIIKCFINGISLDEAKQFTISTSDIYESEQIKL